MRATRSPALLLLAALLAAAGPAPAPPDPSPARSRAARASWEVSPSPPGAAESGVPLDALEGALDARDALDAALGEEEAPAWRELWYASLEARRRQPVLNATREDVVAQLGATAFLHCPVRHLGERGISWVRRRDWHIISSGLFMYTNDERFQVLHSEGSDDWTLQIKFVQKRDNGTYECQVSTAAGPLSRLVALTVLVPEAFILGADEHHVDKGSTISLVCIIEKSPVPPQYVFWYHNERMINYDAARGVAVATAPGARTQSSLTIRDAAPRHSGNYSCRAPNTEPAAIYVYVSEGSEYATAPGARTQSSLTIRDAAPRHSGNYSCRAPNTEPAAIYVYVSEGSEYATAPGARTQSSLTIRDAAPRHSGNYSCRAPNTEPAAIYVNVSEGSEYATAPGARTQSSLTIRDAAPRHSGNYSCRAPNTEPAAIYVYVSEGSDKMAATLSRSRGAWPRRGAGAALLLAAATAAWRAQGSY